MHSANAIAAALRSAPLLDEQDSHARIDLFTKLLAATDAARTELKRQLGAQGLTELGFEVLSTMRSQSEPAVLPSAISEATGILRGTLTDVLLRLEMSGLITRRRSSGDRRQVFAEMTPLGRKRCESASAQYCAAIVAFMHKFERPALSTLDSLLGEIAQGLAEVQQRALFPIHES
jgi:DNA-binding MarR family transcriptional regulator